MKHFSGGRVSRAAYPGPALDFVVRRQTPRVAWLLGATGALVFAAVAWEGIALWQVQADQDAALARWSARDSARQPPAVERSAALPAVGAATAWRTVDALAYPWPRLLAAVDEATRPRVQWLGLQHQSGQADLHLEGLVPDAEAATALMAALASQPGLTTASLTRLSRAEGPLADGGLRFEISARVSGPGIERAASKR